MKQVDVRLTQGIRDSLLYKVEGITMEDGDQKRKELKPKRRGISLLKEIEHIHTILCRKPLYLHRPEMCVTFANGETMFLES